VVPLGLVGHELVGFLFFSAESFVGSVSSRGQDDRNSLLWAERSSAELSSPRRIDMIGCSDPFWQCDVPADGSSSLRRTAPPVELVFRLRARMMDEMKGREPASIPAASTFFFSTQGSRRRTKRLPARAEDEVETQEEV